VTRTRLPALLVACAVLFTACSDGGASVVEKESDPRPTEGEPAGGSQELTWSTCTGTLTSLAGLECATLDVPLDPDDPSGEQITLALARSRSNGSPDERIGSLVINPGGPGGSGLEFLANAAAAFPDELTRHFDLVSFDPRGVGDSDPVRCLTDEEKDAQLEGDLTPDTPEEREKLERDRTALRDGCEERNPEMVRHMSTADVAADLDRIRAALGDEKLNYLGFSYGTSIGATYAAMFPTHIRAMVLDGSTSPSASVADQALVQATGFERTLAHFIEACNADESCALAPDAASAIQATRDELERDPVVVRERSGTRTLTRDLFDYGLATALYDTSTWGPTATAIAEIRDGGATTFLALVDRQTGRQPDGSYDNSSDAQAMVNCADETDRPTPEEALQEEARIAQAAPTFGPLLGTGLDSCHDWPEPANPTPEPKADGAPPILVIGTLGDPATPYEWSEEMAAALTGSVLLTYEGDGHTAFLRGGRCVDDAVVEYLVDLTLPAPGTRCPAQRSEATFAGPRDELVEQLTESGVPATLAECIVDGMIERVGESEFNDMLLKNEQEEITKVAQAVALECATSGRG
jgi:pimeloyl-ACP methyl ester carboxylesterase